MSSLITFSLPKDYRPGLDHVRDRSSRWFNGLTEDSDCAEADIREFAAQVYERLVNVEAQAISPMHQTYRFFTRVDIGLVRMGGGDVRFVLNEVEAGTCGLWSQSARVGDTVINGLLASLEDGCWMDPREV